MFEFLFKYPPAVFSKANFVLLGSWPLWVLAATVLAVAILFPLLMRSNSAHLSEPGKSLLDLKRRLIICALQLGTVTILLFLLWQPALSVAALVPQQNIVAVIVDDSRSMAVKDGTESREEQAVTLLSSGLLRDLERRFQVRLYRLDSSVERIQNLSALNASGSTTQIGKGLRQIADEAGTLPIGAVILLSDGADNSGGVDRDTLSELRRRRLPVNTIGFGSEQLRSDVELDQLDIPARALANSRLEARATIRQHGFGGRRARLVLTGGGGVLASRDFVLRDGAQQVEPVEFDAGAAGIRNIQVRVEPLPGEQNVLNNQRTRVLFVDEGKRRILYVEGEPRWEYKFLRRALEDDPAIQVVSMLRTTENRIYRQGIGNPSELADGFPSKPDALFEYQGLILGSMESAFFTPTQQELIRQFVDRRGAGALFLAGRWALADGGYNVPLFAELLPVSLPNRKNTFHQQLALPELTEAGRRDLICRIEDDPDKSSDHWSALPSLANYQDVGNPKPGAVVLARMNAGGNKLPLLVIENYGRGRTGVFASAGSWRWRMQQPVTDHSQERFWRQLSRWLVSATPSRVVASISPSQLEDDGRVELRAEVRDTAYLPTSEADVEARIIRPDGSGEVRKLRPDGSGLGRYSLSWNAEISGSYVAEITAKLGAQALDKDVATFRREDTLAENFHRELNRQLLEKVAETTGGRYYQPRNAKQLEKEISYSEAGITSREIRDLWDMPAVFLALLALRSTEWLLRRKWRAI